MRTSKEAVEFLKANGDLFGFMFEVVMPYLEFDDAKEWVKDGVTKRVWDKDKQEITRENVLAEMRDYMGRIAWNKAINHRGISAGRSVSKMTGWLYLLGDDELVDFALNEANYENYGAPILQAICDKYGFDIPDSNIVRAMAAGKVCPSCVAGLESGCGKTIG